MNPVPLHLRLLAALACLTQLGAQEAPTTTTTLAPILPNRPEHGLPGARPGTERWIVQFQARSFDLRGLQQAFRQRRPAAEIDAIVADLEQRMQSDQAAFVAAAERLGATMLRQWWLVNAAAIEIDPAQLPALRRLPNIRCVEPDTSRRPHIKTATSNTHHAANVLQQHGIVGEGVTIAVIDSGHDIDMNGTGRPHETYFIDNDPSNTSGGGIGGSRLLVARQIGAMPIDSVAEHGTGVTSVCAGSGWSTSDADVGHAPRASIVGYAIADDTTTYSSAVTDTTAWQTLVTDATAYQIKIANNSYGGSPDPLEVAQQALDTVPLLTDIICVVSAGNDSASTSNSQSVANGLAVGSINKSSFAVSSFSSRGPLSGDPARYYPDIAACGSLIDMAKADREDQDYYQSGTSFAAPQVAGAAAQLRARFPGMTGLETKAVLLTSTKNISQENPTYDRNAYGMGMLRNDRAHMLAAVGQFGTADVTASTPHILTVPCEAGHAYAMTIAWYRHDVTSTQWSDLDLTVRNAATQQVLVTASSPRNLYEKIVLTPAFTGELEIVTTAVSIAGISGPQPFSYAWMDLQDVWPTSVSYGSGCPGTGAPLVVAESLNGSGGTTADLPGNNRFGYQITVANPIDLAAVEVFSRSRFGHIEERPIAIWDDSAGLPGTQLATSTVRVDVHAQFYRAQLDAPVTLAPGTYWLEMDHGWHLTDRLHLTTGQWTPLATHNGTQWNLAWQAIPGIRLLEQGTAPAEPLLSAEGTLLLGQATNFRLSQAPPTTFAIMTFGWSDQVANFGPLPFSLSPLGGAGCSVLTSAEVLELVITSAAGQADYTLNLPATSNAIYSRLFGQYVVWDPAANGLGLTLSNGLRVTFAP